MRLALKKIIFRLPEKLAETGVPPDYRYSLANERTFLAWLRTALALLAVGIGIHVLVPQMTDTTFKNIISFIFFLTSAFISVYAWLRWFSNEKRIRLNRELAYTHMLSILSFIILFVILITASFIIHE
ncbi:DUF202 domain-containing protein [Salmonella enterica subsp. enterica serovar Newport]|nr:DUF202 domain-containing protein [Salmonella enterica subsp. enterica serovar Newport]